MGVHPQHDGKLYVGVPVRLGLISGDQLIEVAELAGRIGGDVRLTRQQNFVLTGVAESDLAVVLDTLTHLGLPVDAPPLHADALACTGEPHCNFSVTETKGRMDGLVTLLEERFGGELAGLGLHLDGCPHACAQHWVGELGFQGTTVRDEQGERHQAYDVFLRGSLDRPAAIARPVFRRVPTAELDDVVVGLVQGWLDGREEGETFRSFCDRATDDELGGYAGREPARGREVVEA
jgi:ferredoxin-nitrite reductase